MAFMPPTGVRERPFLPNWNWSSGGTGAVGDGASVLKVRGRPRCPHRRSVASGAFATEAQPYGSMVCFVDG